MRPTMGKIPPTILREAFPESFDKLIEGLWTSKRQLYYPCGRLTIGLRAPRGLHGGLSGGFSPSSAASSAPGRNFNLKGKEKETD